VPPGKFIVKGNEHPALRASSFRTNKEKNPPILHRGLFKMVVATLPGVYAPGYSLFRPFGYAQGRLLRAY